MLIKIFIFVIRQYNEHYSYVPLHPGIVILNFVPGLVFWVILPLICLVRMFTSFRPSAFVFSGLMFSGRPIPLSAIVSHIFFCCVEVIAAIPVNMAPTKYANLKPERKM